MTVIVYGIGAIGGTIAARLALSGTEVKGIARGAQLDAIGERGLLLRMPMGVERARFPVVADPGAAAIGADDLILLTVKSQDTPGALAALREAGVTTQPIFCMQNGVDNERAALRLFPAVYGVTVMMPATFITPGEVTAFGAPHSGIFDIGRYPAGTDATVERLAGLLTAAGFAAFAHPRVMDSKYGKLLVNLGNAVGAIIGAEAAARSSLADAARQEALQVFAAAGIAPDGAGDADPRRAQLMQPRPVAGAARVGSSSAQSLLRRTGSIETDYLNGEIVLLGRLNGVSTPVNAWLCRLAHRMLREGLKPGDISQTEAESVFGEPLPA